MKSATIDLTGQLFGRLTARTETRKGGRSAWVCDCLCGNTHVAQASELRLGRAQSCGCLKFDANLIDITGQQFGRLTVLERVRKSKRQGGWLCNCQCGRNVVVATDHLKSGHTKSCGCLNSDITSLRNQSGDVGRKYVDRTQAARNKLLTRYKKGATTRQLTWGLTDDQCFHMFKSPCHYCGRTEVRSEYPRTHGVALRSLEPYRYNGIDRKDNTRGYEPDNCVACCTDCNLAKSNRTYAEFTAYLDVLAQFRRS